jgi:hypothetical protein
VTFLSTFHIAFDKAITNYNILASFRGAGLVLHDPQRVLWKLDVVLRTLTSAPLGATVWQSKTPATMKEVEIEAAKQPVKKVRKGRCCRRRGKSSYDSRTRTAKILDLDNSNASKSYFEPECAFCEVL